MDFPVLWFFKALQPGKFSSPLRRVACAGGHVRPACGKARRLRSGRSGEARRLEVVTAAEFCVRVGRRLDRLRKRRESAVTLSYQMLRVRSFRAIPFPGADSIFSSLCGAICGRIRSASSAAIAGGFARALRGRDASRRLSRRSRICGGRADEWREAGRRPGSSSARGAVPNGQSRSAASLSRTRSREGR